jgi:hypothetical protein
MPGSGPGMTVFCFFPLRTFANLCVLCGEIFILTTVDTEDHGGVFYSGPTVPSVVKKHFSRLCCELGVNILS